MIIQTSTLRYRGDDRINITVGTGGHLGRVFGPQRRWVQAVKRGRMGWADYTRRYLAKMRRSFVLHRNEWEALLAREQITLCCYCAPGDPCHRLLLKDCLRQVCEARGIEFVDGGEVAP